jgi:hypothetical protein
VGFTSGLHILLTKSMLKKHFFPKSHVGFACLQPLSRFTKPLYGPSFGGVGEAVPSVQSSMKPATHRQMKEEVLSEEVLGGVYTITLLRSLLAFVLAMLLICRHAICFSAL